MEIISTESLTKNFGAFAAIDDISIQVKQGEIYGFLGVNGAGKTTLITSLLGMIQPSKGNIRLFGKELNHKFNQWNDIGYLVETPKAYPNLSVTENLKVFYILRQLNRPGAIDGIIEKLKLTKYKDKKAKNLSLGNQQRLGLAKALMHKPKLLILDEPINGLDPEGIVEVRELLKELAFRGTTVFLSSHILGEISKISNRIGIIHNGKLIKELGTKELSDQLIKKVVIDTTDNKKAIEHLSIAQFNALKNNDGAIEIYDDEAIAHPESISKMLVEKGIPPKKIFVFTEDLEMFFLRTIKDED